MTEENSLHLCAICGELRTAEQIWFLVAESRQEDKLRILEWNQKVLTQPGVYCACSPAHVEEIVVQWMSTGRLDAIFACCFTPTQREVISGSALPWVHEPDIRGIRQIGELVVDRENVRRILIENPDSLQVILDELTDALQRETCSSPARLESPERFHPGPFRQS